MSKEAMKLALEALETERPYLGPMPSKTSKAITALQEALTEQFCDNHCTWLDHHPDCDKAEQPAQQEPSEVQMRVGKSYWAKVDRKTPAEQLEKAHQLMRDNPGVYQMRLLYTTPQVREPLTDEQRSKMYRDAQMRGDSIMLRSDYEQGITDTEAAHGITKGNT